MLGELLHLIRALEKRSASTAVTDSIAHRLANPVASSPIQSIQRGTIALSPTGGGGAETSATATITSVTTGKSFCTFLGWSRTATPGTGNEERCRIGLTNSTTVTAVGSSDANGATFQVAWEVVEFK